VTRFDVYLVNLNPTIGAEIKNTHPCLVISPDEMNEYIQTVIIAPMTTKTRAHPSRVATRFEGKEAYIVLDQLRTVDKGLLVKYLGRISAKAQSDVLTVLAELFAE